MKNISEIKEFSELNLRQTFRAYIIYEQIMEHSFTGNDGINGIIVLFYCYICGSNHDTVIDYNEYLDWLDEHPFILQQFVDWFTKDTISSLTKQKGSEQGVDESKKA